MKHMSRGRRIPTASYQIVPDWSLMICEICGVSDKNTRIINSKKYGCLCRKHYLRKYKNKNIERSIYDPNEYILHDDHAEIVLYDKNGEENGRAIIDLEDVERCKKYKWHIRKSRNTNYVVNNTEKRFFLHQYILDYYNQDMDIDHINRNGLDNRKTNLRIVTHSRNIMNQGRGTGIKRVQSGRYQASIWRNYQMHYIGTYDTFDEAYSARKAIEERYD